MSDVAAPSPSTTKAAKPVPSPALVVTKPVAQTLREAAPRTLKPSSFQGSEFARARFDAVIPADWDVEDALKPGFWSYVIHRLKPNPSTNEPDRTGAFIDLASEDHAFYALLYVREVRKDGMVVQCIGPSFDPKTGRACPVDLQTGLPWMGRKFEIEWNAAKKGFDVTRKADGQLVADGAELPTRELAVAWIARAAKAS